MRRSKARALNLPCAAHIALPGVGVDPALTEPAGIATAVLEGMLADGWLIDLYRANGAFATGAFGKC